MINFVQGNGILSSSSPAVQTSGSITGSGGTVVLNTGGSFSSTKIVISGSYTGTLQFEQSVNGIVYTPAGTVPLPLTLGLPSSPTTTATGAFVFNAASTSNFRVRATAWTAGTASIIINSSEALSLAIVNVMDDGIILSDNSTSTPLTASEVFTGGTHDVLAFSSITVFSKTDQSGTLQVQWSTDGSNWDDDFLYSIAAAQQDNFVFHRRARYFRLVWTNGTTPQGAFRLQAIGQKVSTVQNIKGLNETVDDNSSTQLSRAIIVGKSAASGTYYVNAQILDHDNLGGFSTPGLAVRAITDSYRLSAFNEQRVSQPLTILNLINRYGVDTRVLATTATLSASVSAFTGSSSIRVAVSASSSTVAEVSTRRYFHYQAGHGTRWLMSIVNSDTGTIGQNRTWGYFDNSDGLMFKLSGTALGVVQRSNTSGVPVDTFVSQSVWNIDPMNGTGPSLLNLDLTKGNIYECNFQWLGVGNVTFFIDGNPVHRFNNINSGTSPYMATAGLPLRARVNNASAAASGSLQLICAQVSVENGSPPAHWTFGAENLTGYTTSGTTEIPILSIQLTGTYNGVDNRASVKPRVLSLANVSANPAIFRLRTNMSLSGPTWQNVDAQSVVMYDTSSQSGSGGQLVGGGLFINGNSAIPAQDLAAYFPGGAEGYRDLVRDPYTGVSDTLSITVQRISGQNAAVSASLTWGEEL